jgi:phage terminase large subunit-like protein
MGVLNGRVTACRWVRLMCQRHVGDLKHGRRRGLYFDRAAAQHAMEFFNYLHHSKGEWAGQVVKLEPWQQAIVWVLFGWYKKKTHTRRFRQAYIEIARKNGKSTFASGLALYMLLADGEPGAEVYSAATKRDQAKVTFDEAARMVRKSPFLSEHITVHKDKLFIKWDTASKYEPVGRDADTMDGLNIQFGLVDELHAHRTSEVWDVLLTGMGSRRQSMMFGISTAGFNQSSFCYSQRFYLTQILDGVIANDAFFGVIYTLDEDDDPFDERVWVKANPNLGVSVYPDELRDLAAQAKEMPAVLSTFLTKRVNIWTRAKQHWIHPDKWKACAGAVDPESLEGRVCYGGLDLSNTLDLTAFVLVFPPAGDDQIYQVLPRFWVPASAVTERSRSQRVPYDVWQREGYLTGIPGEVIDYEWIYKQIDEDAQKYDLREIAFDRWGAAEIYVRMAKQGMTMAAMGQGYASMSPPMKKLEELIVGRRIAHGGHPVLTWNAHNVVATRDAADNIKPDKALATEKIDGIVALIMGLDRATRHDPAAGESVYEERGVLTL